MTVQARAILGFCLAGCAPEATAVVLRITAEDASAVDEIDVRITLAAAELGPVCAPFCRKWRDGPPVEVVVLPGSRYGHHVAVAATGLRGGVAQMQSAGIVLFADGHTRLAELPLDPECDLAECPGGSCGDIACSARGALDGDVQQDPEPCTLDAVEDPCS